MQKALLIILLLFMPFVAIAENNPLPVDKAYSLNVKFNNDAPQSLLLQWKMMPGYYIYRDSVQVKINSNTAAKLILPPAIFKQDLEAGKEAIYADQFNVVLPMPPLTTFHISVGYQGCSQAGFCYPPLVKQYAIDIPKQLVVPITRDMPTSSSLNSFLTDQNKTHDILGNKSLFVTLGIFLGLGILLGLTPCVLPMVPILVSIIIGHKQQTPNASNKHIFSLCLSYVLGVAFTYALVGMIAALLGSSIQVWLQKPLFIVLGSLIFAVLGLSLFGVFEIYVFKTLQNVISNWTRHLKGGSHLSVFTMGVLSVLLISPCTTAPLIGVLLYIGQTGNALLGASTLFLMGIGMGIPLLMVGMSAGKWLPRRGAWMEWVKRFFGVLMIAMACWILVRANIISLPYSQRMKVTSHQFITIHNVDDFKKQIAIANKTHRPIILDFYADWCGSCVVMEKNVFNNKAVVNTLIPFIMLRVDMTENTLADEMLMKHFKVIAPPTLLFFDKTGNEVDKKRIVGEVDAKEFVYRVNSFIEAGCNKSATC